MSRKHRQSELATRGQAVLGDGLHSDVGVEELADEVDAAVTAQDLQPAGVEAPQAFGVEVRAVEDAGTTVPGSIFHRTAQPELAILPVAPTAAGLHVEGGANRLDEHALTSVPNLAGAAPPNVVGAGAFGNQPSVRQAVEHIADAVTCVRFTQNAVAFGLSRTSIVRTIVSTQHPVDPGVVGRAVGAGEDLARV